MTMLQTCATCSIPVKGACAMCAGVPCSVPVEAQSVNDALYKGISSSGASALAMYRLPMVVQSTLPWHRCLARLAYEAICNDLHVEEACMVLQRMLL